MEYFVSYYDYYQPEAYVPTTDTYIEKDSDINDEIDKLRHSATASLSERRDVIIVASVSCIYGLGSPIDYENQVLSIRPGMEKDRNEMLRKLVDIQYTRNDLNFTRGTFRVRGDVIDIYPAGAEHAVRIELFGDEVEQIKEMNPLTGEITGLRNHVSILPRLSLRYLERNMDRAILSIEAELERTDKMVQRKGQTGRSPEAGRDNVRPGFSVRRKLQRYRKLCTPYQRPCTGLPTYTLIDYFPDDF